MLLEELETREKFLASHGIFLPDDLCPYVPEHPVLYILDQEGAEGGVILDEGIVAEVREPSVTEVVNVMTEKSVQARRNLGLNDLESGSIG